MNNYLKKIQENIENDIEELSQYTATIGEGTTRLPFTKESRQAVDYIKKVMNQIGMNVNEDYAGSVIGKLECSNKDDRSIIIGSHYDSVKNGGNFDGIAGVVCGLKIAELIKKNNIKLKYNLEVIGINDEEGVRFGTGFFGSRAMMGLMKIDELKKYKDENNVSIYEAMTDYGLEPEKICEMNRDPKQIKSFIEIHIEQGPILENNKNDIGIVEHIVGMQRYIVTIFGRADHAGTTPMNMRCDAMETAVKVISKIGDLARNYGNGTVATVGYIKTYPNAVNIVPLKVEFSIDIRSKDNDIINKIFSEIKENIKRLCSQYKSKYTIESKLSEKPIKLSEKLAEDISDICEHKKYKYQKIDSGAGHDSLVMGKLTETSMVFVPSRNGRSHCKEEWTDYKYLAEAVDVVYELILKMNL